MSIPVPLSGSNLGIPEIALFKRDQRLGVAKFASVAYAAKDGAFVDATDPQYGFSHETRWVVLLLFSWTTSDFKHEDDEEQPFIEAPWR
jgi:hypothetical protein